MAVPKRRQSRARRNKRRTHQRLGLPTVTLCPQCRQPKRPHRACPTCGTYRGRQVVAVEEV